MIIWISGAYGVGKSTLAEALAKKMDAIVFDAEEVGNAVRGNYPGEPHGVIFEDYPLWCVFNFELLKDIHKHYQQDILVPMTLVRQNSCDRIIQRLKSVGIDTKLIILEASHQIVHDRILARGEDEACWCMRNIEMARAGATAISGGFHIVTDNKSVDELAEEVLLHIDYPWN